MFSKRFGLMDRLPVKHAFAPVVDAQTRVLVLGSLPGERSLAVGAYYAHPTNAFWWIMGQIVGEEALAAMPYAQRLARLRAAGIGLWDVIGSARRQGSLDGAIRDAVARDLRGFAARLPALRAIAFNRAMAARLGRRDLAGAGLTLLDLPSTSAAHASLGREGKLAAWRAISPYLDPGAPPSAARP
jgi:hypoxanthine-DNA glycosylase